MILILITSLLGGYGNNQTTQEELTKVRLCEVVHSIFYAPQYVAINEGIFADEGLDIELTTGQGAHNVMTALLSGNDTLS